MRSRVWFWALFCCSLSLRQQSLETGDYLIAMLALFLAKRWLGLNMFEHVWTCLKVSCFCNVQKELGQTLVVGTSWIVEINIASNHNEQHEHLTARIRQNPTESDGVRFRFVKASSGAGERTQHRDLHSAIELKRLKRPARNNSE